MCKGLSFNKVAGIWPATLLKKTLWHRCFLVNFAKFLRTPFLQNISVQLLEKNSYSIRRVFPMAASENSNIVADSRCAKSVRIRSYSGPYAVRMQENTDENNSEYGHFLRSE